MSQHGLDNLADRIEQRLRDLPARNPGYISFVPETLGNILASDMLRKIAEIAAAEARVYYTIKAQGK